MLSTESSPIQDQIWNWRGFPVRYQTAGTTGRAVLLVHGFGASSGHWRKNIPDLAPHHRVYAIDLLGFGRSPKPAPGEAIAYTFETWAEQILDFCREVIGEPAFLVGNSIGCVVALQAAVTAPDWVRAIALINCSLRLLHDRKRQTLPWYRRYTAPLLQAVLTNRTIGHYFFSQIARPDVIRKILLKAYRRADAVTDELVNILLEPAMESGAADVFLAFTRYSQGPLAEDLLPQLSCPALLLWGTEDPWEPIELGRSLAHYAAVEAFIPLEGLGHCPQDEAPELVDPILLDWMARHSTP